MDTRGTASIAAGTALIRNRSKRISTKRNTFQLAYDLTIESRQIKRLDPRDEDLWPYYLQAAHARVQGRAVRKKRQLPRKVRAILTPRLLKELNTGPSFRLPSRSPEPIFVNLSRLHSQREYEDSLGQSSGYGSGDETETDEEMPVAEPRIRRPAHKASKGDRVTMTNTDSHNEAVIKVQTSPITNIPITEQSVEPPTTLYNYIIANSTYISTESPNTLEQYDEYARRTFLEVQSYMQYLNRMFDQVQQLPSIASRPFHTEIASSDDTGSELKVATPLVQQPEAIHAATSSQLLSASVSPAPKLPASSSEHNALKPRSSNTHLEPRLLERPSAAAIAKMESTTPTTRGNGTGKSDQEPWSTSERQLLHRAANQWWHWKDNNKLSKGASSGAALYRYFELVFAEAGIFRSYYQLKNQWSRNERARFGRSEQRNRTDGSARDLVTSARPAAKARVEAEAAKSINKRSRIEIEIDDDEEEDEDHQAGGYGSQPKLARFS